MLAWLNASWGKSRLEHNNCVLIKSDLVVSGDKCFEIMDQICKLVLKKYDIKERMNLYIYDAKGDDFIQTYLSKDEQDSVVEFITKINFLK